MQVLDIGCAEGELLSCLCNPAPWFAPPPHGISPNDMSTTDTVLLKELHQGILHPSKIAGLDVSRDELERTIKNTQPLASGRETSWHRPPARWEPLEVNIWEGGLECFNEAFVNVECVVATEVYVLSAQICSAETADHKLALDRSIEHLPETVLARFAPVVLGAYHPRILLVTTPSYTFNARFTAPDAPREARCGWPDPTERTDRVFRHHDHKFEWTVEEFTQWCNAIAAEWGYDIIDIGGVGTAKEEDEWGRDRELGYASQVAAFKRREGGEWAETRERRWKEADTRTHVPCQHEHQLLASHEHVAHEKACKLRSLHEVSELVISKMLHFRETTVALTDIWFEREVESACGGWIDWLVRAIRDHSGLALEKTLLGSSEHEEWVVRLDLSLHHLIPPDSQVDAWASSPDMEEVEDPGDLPENDTLWGQVGGVVIKDNPGDSGVETVQYGWNENSVESGWGWGDPTEGGWDKDTRNDYIQVPL